MLSVSRWLSCPYPAVHAKDQVRQLCCRIAPYIGISLLRVCPSACKRPADWKRDAEGVGPTTADFHLESYHGCCQVSRCLNFWYALFRHQRPREFCESVYRRNFLEAAPGNKAGHWEPIELVSLHDQILAEAGRSAQSASSSWEYFED